MSIEAVIGCCCATPNLCCPFTTLSYATGPVSIEFDQIINQSTNPMRLVTCQRNLTPDGLSIVSYTPARLDLSANLIGATVVNRVGPGPSGAGGRCAYRAIKPVNAGPFDFTNGLIAPNGISGAVVRVPVGDPLDPLNPNLVAWSGNANLAGTAPGSVAGMRVWLTPYFQPVTPISGTYWLEAGLACGDIAVGTVTPFPFTGCPVGLIYGPGQSPGNFGRGRVRRYDRANDNTTLVRLGGPSGSVFDLQGNPLPDNNYPESSFFPTVT